jgi:hypothetical protein
VREDAKHRVQREPEKLYEFLPLLLIVVYVYVVVLNNVIT